MTGQEKTHNESFTPGDHLYQEVRAGFVRQGTSFSHWCKDSGVARQNAASALLGGWRGPKARAFVKKIMEASGHNPRSTA